MRRLMLALLVLALLHLPAGYARSAAPPALRDLAGHWSQPDVQQAVAQGWVSGYPDGTFQPDALISRAEFVKLLAAGIGLQPRAGGQGLYRDTDGHWLQMQGWLWVAQWAGLFFEGEYPELRFQPDAPLTRDEAASMAARALGRGAETTIRSGHGLPFSDKDQIRRYRGEVEVAARYGLLTGMPDGSFQPRGYTTRAQAVVIVRRVREARTRAQVAITTGQWEPMQPWPDCGRWFAPKLQLDLLSTSPPDGPFPRQFIGYLRSCFPEDQVVKLSAANLRVQVSPSLGWAPHPMPLVSVPVPPVEAVLPGGNGRTLPISIGAGLAPGWYTTHLVGDVTAVMPDGTTQVISLPEYSTKVSAGTSFLVTDSVLPGGHATVSPRTPATIGRLPVPALEAGWGKTNRFTVSGQSCWDGHDKEMEISIRQIAATGPGFASALPLLASTPGGVESARIPGEADELLVRAQAVVRTCQSGEVLGQDAVFWVIPLTR